jgi:hypothetical protein
MRLSVSGDEFVSSLLFVSPFLRLLPAASVCRVTLVLVLVTSDNLGAQSPSNRTFSQETLQPRKELQCYPSYNASSAN